MVIFRNLTLQRLLCCIFLGATLLSHTQMLFACEFMHGKPKMVCCCDEAMSDACPMTNGCAMQSNLSQNQCCEVSQDSLSDVAVTHAGSTVETLTLLLDSPQPPPPTAFRETPVFLQALSLILSPPKRVPISGGEPIFLRTLRIRL
ncbi:MAG: hypothetical protein ACU836_07945 [Gammaproteobacteria bacterium]